MKIPTPRLYPPSLALVCPQANGESVKLIASFRQHPKRIASKRRRHQMGQALSGKHTERHKHTHTHAHIWQGYTGTHTLGRHCHTLSFFVFHVGKLKLFDLQLYVADSKVVSGAPHAAWPAVAQRQLTLPCQRAGEGEKGAVV